MILVTGAAGKTGNAVIRALVAVGEQVCALVRRPEQVNPVQKLGAQQVIIGDMCSPQTLSEAVQGVRAIYHICSNMNANELSIGVNLIEAARLAGVERFVYHSVLHPHTEAMPHHWLKLRVEEKLFESGLNFTILQPCAYMQNILAHRDSILNLGIYPVPYAVETRLSLVDLQDVALAAAKVLTQPSYGEAIYELVGTVGLSQLEVADILSQQIGRPVRAQQTSLSDWEKNARNAAGLSDYAVSTLLKMFNYYQKYGFCGNPNVLKWILGRKPTDLSDFIAHSLMSSPTYF